LIGPTKSISQGDQELRKSNNALSPLCPLQLKISELLRRFRPVMDGRRREPEALHGHLSLGGRGRSLVCRRNRVPGLAAEAATVEEMENKLLRMVPEVLALNGAPGPSALSTMKSHHRLAGKWAEIDWVCGNRYGSIVVRSQDMLVMQCSTNCIHAR